MHSSELPTAFEAGEGMITYTQVHRIFASSVPGKALSGRTRFLRFKPEGIPEEEWRAVIGVEADRLQHLLETWKYGKKFLFRMLEAGGDMSESDRASLQLACLMHDWPGTEPDELMHETPASDSTRGQAIRSLLPDVLADHALCARLERAVERVFEDPSSGLEDCFLAIEGIASLDLLAWSWKKGAAIKGAYQEWFRYFGLRLCVAAVPGLLRRSRYPAAALALAAHRDTIDAILGMSEADLRYFPPDGFPRAHHPKGFIDSFDLLRDGWADHTKFMEE